MSADPKQVQAIFLAASEIANPVQRMELLQRECGLNAELRQRVEALLKAHDASGELPEAKIAPAETTVTSPLGPSGGMTIAGRYRLLEEIAEGGMGTVWVAQQTEPVRRRVAVKLIKTGMDSRQVLSRFEAERQALALMDHPNIAKVFDGGVTDQGRPYFVMEYVKGVPITKYCDEAKLTVPERLKLFVPVCQAVQHAHQKGIIHRDLKPSNILVCLYDGQPVPKVIDFGLAKAMHQPLTEHTLYTAHGLMVGTPLYMSPEQAEFNNLDIDTRTDIYSLGVILYELLTGTTPLEKQQFKNAAWQEILRLIKEEEPSKPSTKVSGSGSLPTVAAQRGLEPAQLTRIVRGDLDLIVMKALEKERSRRYETANGLARDIERYLNDQPVEASPPSTAYRFRKFARRNRTIITTSALVLSTLVIGIVVSATQAIRATRAEQIVQSHLAAEKEARQEAEIARKEADENARQARQTVDDYFTLVSESELLEVPGLQPLRQQLLESALKYYESFRDQRTSDSSLRAELVAMRLRISQVYEQNNRIDDSIQELSNALDLVEALLQENPRPNGFPENLAGFRKSGRIVTFVTLWPADGPQAVRVYQRATSLWEQFVRGYPNVPGFSNDLASFYSSLSDYQIYINDFTRSLQSSRRGQEILEPLMQEHPHDPEYRSLLADLLEYESRSQIESQHLQEADVASQRAFGMREKLVEEFPDTPNFRANLANSRRRRAGLLDALGHFDAAIAFSQRGVDLWRQLLIEHPTVSGYSKRYGDSLFQLAKFQRRGGRMLDAEKTLQTSVAMLAKLTETDWGEQGDNLIELNAARLELHSILYANGKHAEAEEQVRLADVGVQKHAEKYPGRLDDTRGHTSRLLAFAADVRKDFKAAEEFLRRAVEVFKRLATVDPTRLSHWHFLADTHRWLGMVLWEEKRLPEAEAELRQAIDIHEKAAAELNVPAFDVREWASCYINLADFMAKTNRMPEAETPFRRFFEVCDRFQSGYAHSPSMNDILPWMRLSYSNYLVKANRREEAVEQAKLAVDLLLDAQRSGRVSPFTANELAWSLVTRLNGDLRLSTAAVDLAKLAVQQDPDQGNFWNTLGVAQYRVGDFEAARTSLSKGMVLRKGGDPADWFFLAMTAWKRGQMEAARNWYEAAFLSMAKHQRNNSELIQFHAEARELLELPDRPFPEQVDDLEIAKPLFQVCPDTVAVWCVDVLLLDHVRFGRWMDVKTYALRRCELMPNEPYCLYQLAAILARVGDLETYQQSCRKLLDRYADTNELEWAERSSKVGLLLPARDNQLQDASRLADRAATRDPQHWALCFSYVAAALAAYRTDRFQDSVEWADKALACHYERLPAREAHAHYVRAMALERLGKHAEAKDSFEIAAKTLQEIQADLQTKPVPEWWHDIAICELLQREAEKTLHMAPNGSE